MTQVGICKLCLKERELQNSHAIPNAYFRRIFRESSGNAIRIVGDEFTEIDYTNDSGKELQLCRSCESLLNKEYENYTLNILSGKSHAVTRLGSGVSYGRVNGERLILFFISIVWRAANSSQSIYEKVHLTDSISEDFRRSILYRKAPSSRLVGVRCQRLIDKTPGGFFRSNLANFIAAPFPRLGKHYASYILVFAGLIAEVRIGGFRIKQRSNRGMLSKKGMVLFVPDIDVLSVPEINEVLVRGFGKHFNGRSRVS
ncbi:hypothetical protein DET50_107129 [Marinobacter pelagius]|uniref:HNH endonuclease n=1 Tax=Marinobacter pelagius TaxID=379482 RepID=A0A366GSL3_9GAMM|nr:hypothetical protein [Marinobacter pelagius]RBP30714.1 hypothetical protein DET50_107129 [Marinobacter pelagius]